MKKLNFEFVIISKVVESLEVDSVLVPCEEGPLEIYPDHAPLMALVKPGRIVLKTGGKRKSLVVERGVLQVEGNKALVLANRAINSGDVNTEEVQEKTEQLRAMIQQGTGKVEKEKLRRKLAFLEEQLKVSSSISNE